DLDRIGRAGVASALVDGPVLEALGAGVGIRLSVGVAGEVVVLPADRAAGRRGVGENPVPAGRLEPVADHPVAARAVTGPDRVAADLDEDVAGGAVVRGPIEVDAVDGTVARVVLQVPEGVVPDR